MKKISILVLIPLMTMIFQISVPAQNTHKTHNIKVTVDGQEVIFDQVPVIIDNRVFVPIRAVAEAMGHTVIYYGPSEKLTDAEVVLNLYSLEKDCYIYFKTQQISIWDKSIGYTEEYTKPLEQTPVIVNNRTLIGVRNLAETLYCNVDWDEAARTVIITKLPIIPINNKSHELPSEIQNSFDAESYTPISNTQESFVTSEQYRQEVIELINEERTKSGLNPVKEEVSFMQISQLKSDEMAELNYFSHVSPQYGAHTNYAKNLGANCTIASENIAAGYSTPKEVVAGWMKSEVHKRHILDEEWTLVGIGYSYNAASQYGSYWSLFLGV